MTSASARAPSQSCDCHFHIFGPFERFPLDPGRAYELPEASIEAYEAIAARLGIERMVVVQPSPYGTDNGVTLDAVRRFGPARARAVAVIDESFDHAALRRLHEGGVRGVRFNLVSGNGTPEDQLLALARRIAPLGWHVQVYAEGDKLHEMAPMLAQLPVDVVIDHIGGVRSALGTGHPQFQSLLRLLGTGRAWVKLCGYRASSAGYPWDDVAANIQALAGAAPERCVWGTDWPHVHMPPGPQPDPGPLLAQFLGWVPDTTVRRRVLVENPAALYDF